MKKRIKFIILIMTNITLLLGFSMFGNAKVINVGAATENSDVVQRMLREINQFRKVSGLKPVVYNEAYAQFAQGVAEKNAKNGTLQHSTLNAGLVPGDVTAMESISMGYGPEESIWAYISDDATTMGHCHSLLMPDRSTMGIGMSKSYGALFASSSSGDMSVAKKVCQQLNQKSLADVRAYIWNASSQSTNLSVNYRAHVQNVGWQDYVKDGALAGTSGRGLRVESFRMKLSNLPVPGDISYATHIQNIGWQEARTNDQISGTTGQSLRMEAMRINLTGEIAKQYDVYYRTHIENFGWLGWSKNGENAGSEGRGLRMEAIEVRLVKKGDTSIKTGNGFVGKPNNPSVNYSAHVQNIGWQNYVNDGQVAGTFGRGLRVESFRMNLSNLPVSGDISYAT
ncbi:MAG: CAP domain-containing protein, partial [Culicoidibacterales bacterium]